MPPRHDLSFVGLDESDFKFAVRKTTTSVPETKTSISKTSKDIVEKSKTDRPIAPIIEEWDTDNDNDSVFRPKYDQTKLKFTKINFVKSGENVNSVHKENTHDVQIVLRYLDSRCSKHMTGNRSQLTNFINKFFDTVKFGNDQIAKIMGYSDYHMRMLPFLGFTMLRDSGIIYSPLVNSSIGDMMKSSPICLLSKASKTKSWLYHRRLSHLNIGTINQLAKQGLVRGLPKLIFEKDHLCSTCSLGKSKKHSHKLKFDDTKQEKLYLLHMDLCGPMHVKSINRKKYILVIVDDYSRFTWVKFLRSKDEAPEFIIKFLKMIQVRLNATVRNICTDISPPPCVDHPVPKVAAPEPIVSIGTPFSTTIDQDAPSPSTSQTPQESPS
ncbi:retrovirus-related pol polyprotein from transposon TNT 1-94 [Tanacetum coccineum]